MSYTSGGIRTHKTLPSRLTRYNVHMCTNVHSRVLIEISGGRTVTSLATLFVCIYMYLYTEYCTCACTTCTCTFDMVYFVNICTLEAKHCHSIYNETPHYKYLHVHTHGARCMAAHILAAVHYNYIDNVQGKHGYTLYEGQTKCQANWMR